jgi:hypothetical protein
MNARSGHSSARREVIPTVNQILVQLSIQKYYIQPAHRTLYLPYVIRHARAS